MSKKEISIVVVPHYGGRTIERRFSVRALKALAVLAGLVFLGLILIVVLATRVHIKQVEFRMLKTRNADLERQLAQLDQLQAELARMKREDERIRAMLGFDRQPPRLDVEQLYRALAESSADSLSRPSRESLVALLPRSTTPWVPSIAPLADFTISRVWNQAHPGIDLVAETGSPVLATADGRILSVGWDTVYGNAVTIQHVQSFRTFYGHLLRVSRLVGDSVHQGEPIGQLGSTGRSTAPHLHYEVIKGKRQEDPEKYFQ
jgi:murein DD-endopeptidase MepM/ murein hydrolase activator NlpD